MVNRALTANAMAEDREKTWVAGTNDYISKPTDVINMRKIMAKWITPS